MYAICEIIYGVPFSYAVKNAYEAHVKEEESIEEFDMDPDELREFGWEFRYSGSSIDIEPGYLGVVLDGIDEADIPAKAYGKESYRSTDDVKLVPDEGDKKKFAELWAKQPEWMPEAEPKVWFIWCTS